METILIQYCILESNRDDHYRIMQINNSGIASVPIISTEIAILHDKQTALFITAILNAWNSENGKMKSFNDIVKFIESQPEEVE